LLGLLAGTISNKTTATVSAWVPREDRDQHISDTSAMWQYTSVAVIVLVSIFVIIPNVVLFVTRYQGLKTGPLPKTLRQLVLQQERLERYEFKNENKKTRRYKAIEYFDPMERQSTIDTIRKSNGMSPSKCQVNLSYISHG